MLGLLAFTGLAFANSDCSTGPVYNLPPVASNGTSQVDYIAAATGLNGPHVHPVNASAYDLWYFDVVDTAPNSNASVVLVFFDTPPGTFPFPPGSWNTSLLVTLAITFPNGTFASTTTEVGLATNATVVVDGEGSSGNWEGVGLNWTYDVVTGAYDVFFDSAQFDGIKGSIHFQPRGAARYPCGPGVPGQTMRLVPNAGYVNPLPDAVATVDLIVDGERLTFTGAGYHDQGWGPQPFSSAVGSWYWGHGRVGPYSVVWFDILTADGVEYVSTYVGKGDTALVTSCDLASQQVRPTGNNATFPPTSSSPKPSGYHITMDLGAEGVLDMNVSVVNQMFDLTEYMRAIAYINGTITPPGGKPGPSMGGPALLEQFALQA
ncbi:hypothetical protein MSAN_00358300 [Mycena sanguinolenta]|uniref:Hydroxyneurosporene synthase n=1 Tax=Mycena sanguinolenta TaxID=230812 RepID=A0A8H6Z8Z4_9AGAR|nr:hypothetical protein MSAN_00358300 [Mycena sanguinolenta]